jgi:hypothetical protein
MTISAIAMIAVGIAPSFLPHEVLLYLNDAEGSVLNVITLQILGALYFAFGMVNWVAKANLIGGIYGRPIAIGNFTHFVIGALALLKAYSSDAGGTLLSMAIVYTVLAILFGIVFFTHPIPDKTK